jgi:hypothetical protein
MWMIGKHLGDRLYEARRAVAVDYSHFSSSAQESFVEKLVDQIDGFVGLLAIRLVRCSF